MRYETRVTAYDMLDQVCVSVTVFQLREDDPSANGLVVSCSTTVQGTGESSPREWARDALVAALEIL